MQIYIVATVHLLKEKPECINIQHMPCVSHTLQLAISKELIFIKVLLVKIAFFFLKILLFNFFYFLFFIFSSTHDVKYYLVIYLPSIKTKLEIIRYCK